MTIDLSLPREQYEEAVWGEFDRLMGRVKELDAKLAFDLDTAVSNLRAKSLDEGRREALAGARISGRLEFQDRDRYWDGFTCEVHFTPASGSEVQA